MSNQSTGGLLSSRTPTQLHEETKAIEKCSKVNQSINGPLIQT